MSAAAITHYTDIVRYDPQAVQRLRDATAQTRQQQQQQLRLVRRDEPQTPAEHTLEGELLDKQGGNDRQSADLTEEEFLARHYDQQSRSTEGYHSPAQRAIGAYRTTAQITHPADVDRIGLLDIYV